MGWTAEAIVSEDGAIRLEDLKLTPGTRVIITGEDSLAEEALSAGYGMLRGTGRITGDIVSPTGDWQ